METLSTKQEESLRPFMKVTGPTDREKKMQAAMAQKDIFVRLFDEGLTHLILTEFGEEVPSFADLIRLNMKEVGETVCELSSGNLARAGAELLDQNIKMGHGLILKIAAHG